MQNAALEWKHGTETLWERSWEAHILHWLIGTVSLNSEIAYLGTAKGDRLTAEALCVKNGRTTSYYRIEVRDEFENLAAVVNTTGYKKA